MNDLDLDMDEEIQSQEVIRLKEKVKALERQNALLKTKSKPGDNGDSVDGAAAVGDLVNDKVIEDIQLIDLDELDAGEDNWLLDVSQEDQDNQEDECSWLRSDVTSPSSIAALKKKSLVNKLDDIAKVGF